MSKLEVGRQGTDFGGWENAENGKFALKAS